MDATGCLLRALLFVIILPVMLVAATPFVLIGALPGSGSYLDRLRSGYRRVFDAWLDLVQYLL
jgi:hypothetical protein